MNNIIFKQLKKLSIDEFIQKAEKVPVIDVRTPAEYELGHFVGAINIPIFTNEERAIVGTLYKKKGKKIAVLEGLEFVGTKLADFARKALEIAKENELLIHCWRGGMRSASMAWLFDTVGIKTYTLNGGYKAYRNHIFNTFDKIKELIVLGGSTGSGKTEILLNIQKKGEQVIDLEGIANHKGSAFGRLGEKDKQPTSEQFANNLFHKIKDFKFDKEIWIEDESKRIGNIHQPDNFYEKLRNARLIEVKLDKDYRINRLLKDYGSFEKLFLIEGINKISKRLGGENANLAIQAIEENNIKEAISISLIYYDKAYNYGVSKRNKELINELILNSNEENKFAEQIIQFNKKINL